MSRTRVEILFNTRGTRRVRRDVTDIGDSARNSGTAVNFLQRSLGALGIGIGLSELVRFSDTATRLSNQLRTVTTSTTNLSKVTDELFQTARRSRSGIEPTVELYSRLQRSTSDLGLSQREILDITEGVTKAFKIFGNTADEAEAAMVQFSQGLASGSIKGDELRSVLEQAPRLAKAIADGFNEIGEADLAKSFGQGFKLDDGTFDYDIVIGSLRNLGQEGELTAERVVRALKTQLGALDEEFQKTLPTIEDAFVQLRNKVIEFFNGPGTQNLGVQITQALLVIVDNFDLIIQGATVASAALITIFVGQGIKAAIAGVRALTLIIAANPIGFLAVALVAATTAAVVFGDKVAGASKVVGATLKDEVLAGVATLVDVFTVGFNKVNEIVAQFFNFFKQSTEESGSDWRENLKTILDITLSVVGGIAATFAGVFAFLKGSFVNFKAVVSEVAVDIENSFIVIGNKIENVWINVGNSIERGIFGTALAIENFFRDAIDSILSDFNVFAAAIERLTGKDFSIGLLGDTELDETRLNIKELVDELEGVSSNVNTGAFTEVLEGAGRAAIDSFSFFTDEVPKMFGANLNEQIEKSASRATASNDNGELTTFGDQRTTAGKIGDGAGGKAQKLSEVEKLTIKYATALEKVNRELDSELTLQGQLGPQAEIMKRVSETTNALLERKIALKIAEAEAANGLAKLTTEEILTLREKVQLLPEEIDGIAAKIEKVEQLKGVEEQLNSVYNESVGKQQELADRLQAVQIARQLGITTNQQFKQSLVDIATETANLQLQIGDGDWVDSAISIMARLQDGYTNILSSLTQNFGDFFSTLTDGFADAIGQSIVHSESLGAALKDVAKQAIAGLISGLVKMGIQFLINAALSKVATKAITTSSVSAAAATAAAWAPAAAAVSLGTAGSNAVPASIGIISTHAISQAASAVSGGGVAQAFADGGFVSGPGTGRSDSVPAMLSNGEFVVNAMSTSQYLPLLKAINNGRISEMYGFMDGGEIGGRNSSAQTLRVPVTTPVNTNLPAANNGSTTIEINVKVEGGNSPQQDRETGRRVAEEIRPVVLEIIRDEKRDGGELENVA